MAVELNAPNESEMQMIKNWLNTTTSNKYGVFADPDSFSVAKLVQKSRLDIDLLLELLTDKEIGLFVKGVNEKSKKGLFLAVHYKIANNLMDAFHKRFSRVAKSVLEEGGISDPANDEFQGAPNYYR